MFYVSPVILLIKIKQKKFSRGLIAICKGLLDVRGYYLDCDGRHIEVKANHQSIS